MKNRIFFAKFFQSMSKARKINFVIALALALAMSCAIGLGWYDGGCDMKICVLGSVFGFVFPMAIWSCVDDVLA